MSLPAKHRELLSLESDLPLTEQDFRAMSKPLPDESRDLSGYLAFLEEIGAFASRKATAKIYPEEFKL